MKVRATLAVFSVFPLAIAFAQTSVYEEGDPVLVVVDVTGVKRGSGDGHAYWHLYEANVREVIAGELAQPKIEFEMLTVPGGDRVFQKQLALLFDKGETPVGQPSNARFEAHSIQRVEPILCFLVELEKLFPNDPRFKATITNESIYDETCYRSLSIVSPESMADATYTNFRCPLGKRQETKLPDGVRKLWCMRERERNEYIEVGRSVYVKDGVVIVEMCLDEEGQLNGLFQTRDELGELTSRGHYRDGAKVGRWLEWDDRAEGVIDVLYPELSGSDAQN